LLIQDLVTLDEEFKSISTKRAKFP
jgi:hypothetical protein